MKCMRYLSRVRVKCMRLDEEGKGDVHKEGESEVHEGGG